MAITPTQILLSHRVTAMEQVAGNAASESHSPVASLTRRLAAGDEAGFREFHKLYFDRLYRFLIVLVRGEEDQAQEALQMTLLRVVRYARHFDSEEAFWCWLKAVARSAARDAGRKQQRYSNLLQRFAASWRTFRTGVPAPPVDEKNQLRVALEESLAELTEEDRQLLECKYLDGDTAKVLAERYKLSQKALESRLLRLRRELRQRMLNKLGAT